MRETLPWPGPRPDHQRRRLVRRLVVALLLMWIVGCAMPFAARQWQSTQAPITDAPLLDRALANSDRPFPTDGQLIYDLPNGKLWSRSLTPDSVPTLLFRQAPGTFAFQPVWSAVTQQIAYGYIQPSTTDSKPTAAQLWIAELDGTNARQVTQPAVDFPGTYRDPTWAPDGQSLWATVQVPQPDSSGVIRMQSEIRRIDVASGRERVIVRNAHSPAIAPNGQSIAYLATDPTSTRSALWQAASDGSNATLLVTGEQFEAIYAPMRFSPDGRFLAFAAADAQNQQQRTPPASASVWLRFFDQRKLFAPTTAAAHGLYPADIWLLEIEQRQLTRLTQLSEDHPTPVWSPDGRYLAFAGVMGVYLVDIRERRAARITEQGVDGQIEWVQE